jgi:hypothetical protein
METAMARIVGALICIGCIAMNWIGVLPEGLAAEEIVYKNAPEFMAEVKRLEKLYPETSKEPRYEKSGHQYTTFIIARMAGVGRELSHKLAYFSQFPDDVDKYSATYAAIRIFNQTYRRKIMRTLHSLHGGNKQAVIDRRNILSGLIQDGLHNRSLEPYQLGLIIHAFADAYAHTKIEDGQLVAFDSVYGHLFHWHTPDLIAYDPPKYAEYACNLYIALAKAAVCRPSIDPLLEMIKQLEKSRNAELPKFEMFAKEKPYEFSEDQYRVWGEDWKQKVQEQDVLSTINFMESQFSNH